MINKAYLITIGILIYCYASCQASQTTLPIPYAVVLPTPGHKQTHRVLTISLNDAIHLALRYNPDVISTELNRLEERFALKVAHDQLLPQFTLNGTGNSSYGQAPSASMTTGMKLTTPFGPTFDLSYKDPFDGQTHSPTASITQNLTQWGLPKLAYEAAQDHEITNQIAYLDALSGYVVNVIQAYRNLVSDKNQLEIQEENFKQSSKQLEDDRLRVRSGSIAPNDLLQSESTLAVNKLDIIRSRFSYHESRQRFLQTLGLDPNTPFEINYTIHVKEKKLPNKQTILNAAFKHNAAYLKALLALKDAKRSLKITMISTRPEIITTASSDSQVNLNFDIPIHRLSIKQQRLQSKIALKNAQNALEQARQQIVFDVNSQIEQIRSQVETIKQAEHTVKLAQKNYDMGQLQKKYGKISQQNLDLLQTDLLTQRINLIGYKIELLNQQTNLRRYCGQTLKHWNIHLRSERDIKKLLS